jgi:hypothetical protein
MTDCTNPRHKGHRYYVGGTMDGTVQHLVYATPSDYPRTFGTALRDGQRSWYEIDDDASEGPEVVYRLIGHGKEFPLRPVSAP